MNTIFIGWDPNESEAYKVAQFSITSRTTEPARIYPLGLQDCGHILKRPIEHKDGKLWCPISEAPMATEFAITRFTVPFLKSKGWALFVDCDIICETDINELFAAADDKYALMCVQHSHESGPDTKMNGQIQTYYKRKNWSSVMLWNCGHPAHERLTKHDLNTWPGRELHAFKWLWDYEIGALHPRWNKLVGVQEISSDPGILHYTLGGPWLPNWKPNLLDEIWLAERKSMNGQR
jgi:hypothetical protein